MNTSTVSPSARSPIPQTLLLFLPAPRPTLPLPLPLISPPNPFSYNNNRPLHLQQKQKQFETQNPILPPHTSCFVHPRQPSAMTRWQPTHCPVCRRLLLHRTGVAIILCPSCHSLLNLHAHPSTPGQTVCFNCTNIIHHPIGPPLLQCRICAATNPAPVFHYTCRVCSLYLAYSSTLPAVVCPICHTVEPPIDAPVSRIPVLLPLSHDAPPRPCPALPPRHIPWLPSTPVRPITTSRSPQHLRAPQHLLVHLPPSSIPAPPGTISQPYHSEARPQPSHSREAAPSSHQHGVPLNGGEVSINGGGSKDNILDDNNQQAVPTRRLPPSSKSVKPEDHIEKND